MTNCRYCSSNAIHFVPFESYDDNGLSIDFGDGGTLPMCDHCHDMYGDYIREYYSPRFELKGAL